MIVNDLKKAILQYASEGKLSIHNNNYSAIDDLDNILLDTKGNRKYKYNTIENPPFYIPKNWVWVRLEDISIKITDGTHSTPKYSTYGIPFLSVKDMSSGYLNFSNTKFISKEEHDLLYRRCNPEFGDLLITKVGTTGVPVIVDTEKEFSLFVSVALVKINKNKINNKYLYYILSSPVVQSQVVENTRGVGNKNWVLDAIKSTIFPLPPLEEQKRIVEKIEELFSKLDELKPIEDELNRSKVIFPKNLKNSILNQILSQYKDNTISLQNISFINGGYAFKSVNYKDNGIRVIRISDFDEYGIKNNEVRYEYSAELNQYKLENGDIIICMTGGTVGKNLLLKNIPDDYYANQRVATVKVNPNFSSKFVYYCINSPFIQKQIQNNKNSTNDNISMDLIKSFKIPNISLDEQQRIVEKIERLLQLCDDIETLVND